MESYDQENIFAKIIRGEIPCHKIYEDEGSLAFMDIMPRVEGHCLVIPKAPSRNILDANPEDLAVTMSTVIKVANALKSAFKADGITLQQFSEPAGGQEVFHTHFHLLPRFDGVKLAPRTGEMADHGELAATAKKIADAL